MLMQFIVNRSSAICWCSQHVSSVIYNLNVYEPVQPFNNDFLPLHFCHGKSTLEFRAFMQMRRKCAAREVSSKIHQIQEECVRAALCSHTQNQIRGKTKKAPNSQICWELNSIKRKRVATSIVDNDHQYVNTCMHDRWFVFSPFEFIPFHSLFAFLGGHELLLENYLLMSLDTEFFSSFIWCALFAAIKFENFSCY